MNERYTQINERVRREWKEENDGLDRVYDVMRNSTENVTALEVAEKADVSPSTARKYLGHLAEMNRVTVDKEGGTHHYSWD